MANHFLDTAHTLREAAAAEKPDEKHREAMRRASDILRRLEQLKRDLISSAPVLDNTGEDDNGLSDRLAGELISLLGLHSGS